MKTIAYGTSEFDEFIDKAPITLDRAWELQLDYYRSSGSNPVGAPLFFIVDEAYLFTPYYNPKIPEVQLKGVAINSQTGTVAWVDKKCKLKPVSQFGWQKPAEEH